MAECFLQYRWQTCLRIGFGLLMAALFIAMMNNFANCGASCRMIINAAESSCKTVVEA